MTETTIPPALLRGAHGDRMLPSLGVRERASLGAMVASGKIGSAEMIAADRWYGTFAMAEYGAFDGEGTGGGGQTVKMFAQERQVSAATEYRKAFLAIGNAGDGRMRAILAEGVSVSVLADRLRQDRKMVTGMVVADLVRLVEHYTSSDGTKKSRGS